MERRVDYLQHLNADAVRLADAWCVAPEAPVPSCPDWNLSRLVSHVGRLHRWAREINAARTMEAVPVPTWPEEGTDLGEWLRDGAANLAETLVASEPDTPVWNHLGQPPTARFWPRRMALETAVHRWDGDLAAARSGDWEGPLDIDPELAADGIDEYFGVIAAPFSAGRRMGDGETIHLHATDVEEGEWIVTLGADGLEFTTGHAKSDVALIGPASDLYLWAWQRRTVDDAGIEVQGDEAVARRWADVAGSKSDPGTKAS